MDRHQRNNYLPNTHEKTSPEKKQKKLPSNIGNGKLLLKTESNIMNDGDSIRSRKPAVLTNQDINNYVLNCVSNLKINEQKSPTHSKMFQYKSMDLSNSADRLQSSYSFDSTNGINHHSIDHGKYPRNSTTKPSLSSPPIYCNTVSTRDSPSPRSSIGSISHELKSSPLYENVDFYNGGRSLTQTPTYYHQRPRPGSHSSGGSQDSRHSSPRTSVVSCEGSSVLYESTYRKAQPQVPVGYPKYIPSMGKDTPPYEAPPVYETISDAKSNNYEPAKPGPQVPTQSIDHIGRYPAQHATPYIKPIPTTNPQVIKTMSDYSSQTNSHTRSYSSSTNNLRYFQNTQDAVTPKSTTKSSQMCAVGQPALAESRSQKTHNSMPKMFQTASAYQRESQSIYCNLPKRTSPTPPLPIKTKHLSKNLLPYNVTPPRPMVIIIYVKMIIKFYSVTNIGVILSTY